MDLEVIVVVDLLFVCHVSLTILVLDIFGSFLVVLFLEIPSTKYTYVPFFQSHFLVKILLEVEAKNLYHWILHGNVKCVNARKRNYM